MNQRDAKRDACRLVALLIENYFEVGQPSAECAAHNPAHPAGADACPECSPREKALTQLRDELERRAGAWVPVTWRRP